MFANTPVPPALLEQAADLRAAGATWEAVAEAVGRAAQTVRRWPAVYPARWKPALYHAERRLARHSGAEGVHGLRALLRSKDEAIVVTAARGLASFWLNMARLDLKAGVSDAPPPAPAPRTPEGARVIAFLDGLPDAELEQLVATLRRFPPEHAR